MKMIFNSVILIKKKHSVILIYDDDGEYIETSKASVLRLLKAIPENFKYIKQDKFVLREDGDLYIN